MFILKFKDSCAEIGREDDRHMCDGHDHEEKGYA